MMESFIESNYQIFFWVVILAIVVFLIFWLFRQASFGIKNNKEANKKLRSKREEITFEIIKSGEGFTEKEIAEFLDISEKEAHKHLMNLMQKNKITTEEDVDKEPIYKERKK